MIACSNGRSGNYIKYVYTQPQDIMPFKASNEVDIWFARAKYRGLLKANKEGLLEKDLAQKFNNIGNKVFEFTLDSDSSLSDGSRIDSSLINRWWGFLTAQKETSYFMSNIENFLAFENSIRITLKKSDPYFLPLIASHLFLVFDPSNLNLSSGVYVKDGKSYKATKYGLSKMFPRVIIPRVWSNESSNDYSLKAFDTSLLPTGKVASAEKYKTYALYETWGIVLNLKDKFKKLSFRKCFDQSINRKLLATSLGDGHKLTTTLSGKLLDHSDCELREQIVVDIPQELGVQAEYLCNDLKTSSRKIDCNIIDFNTMLKRIEKNSFEASLLSLTLDYPYLNSFMLLLQPNRPFRIVNIDVELPLKLTQNEGDEFYEAFSEFVFKNHYFVALSKPLRTINASKLEDYRASLLGPAYDPLENLKR